MKTFKTILAFAFFITFICLTSCSKDDSSNPTDNPVIDDNTESTISADFVGSLNKTFNSYYTIDRSYSSIYEIVGTTTNGDALQVSFSTEVTKGENISIGTKSASIMVSAISGTSFKSFIMNQGTITITENSSSVIKATFSGKTSSNSSDADYLEVKNGSLVIKK